ncbi:MAG: TetR/AcrR family transcriptional regulator [Anaerovoracaceae bacterium]
MSMLTMKVIMKTFEEMLEEMPFDKITVLELAKRCEISHNTFYYHYQDIYELLDEWLRQAGEAILSELDDPGDWRSELQTIFRICRNHPRMVHHILESISRERLERYLFTRTEDVFTRIVKAKLPAGTDDAGVSEIAEFCRYAFAGFFLKFNYLKDMPDVKEYSKRVADYIDEFINAACHESSDME